MSQKKNLEEMVSEMHKALIGDEYRKEGIVHKVERHEKKIKKHDSYIIAIGAGFFVLSFLLQYGDLIKKIITE